MTELEFLKALSDRYQYALRALGEIKKVLDKMGRITDGESVPDYDIKDICLNEKEGMLTLWFLGHQITILIALSISKNTFGGLYMPTLLWESDVMRKDRKVIDELNPLRELPMLTVESVVRKIHDVLQDKYPPETPKEPIRT